MKPYNKSNIKFAKSLRKNMTPWERKLWYDFLREYPVKFQRQKAINNYIVDFYCASAKLVIELDGSQHYETKGKTDDTVRDEFLNSEGLMVLRIANIEIDTHFADVCDYIHTIVCERGL